MKGGPRRRSGAEAGIAVEVPRDPRVPVLDAIRSRGIRAVLADAGVSAPVTAAKVLKRHDDKARCTLLLHAGAERLVLKAWDDDPAPLVELLQALEQRGLASGSAPTVAPLLGYDRDRAFVVQGWLDGPSAHTLLPCGAAPRAGELGAAWLRAAWAADVVVGAPREAHDVLDDVRSRGSALGRAEPELAPLASAVVDLLERTVPRRTTRIVLQHGTFRTDQVIDLGDGPGVLDWDSFARGAPEHDAGTFLGWLSYSGTARRRARAADEAAAAADAFTADLDGLDGDALAWYRAAALLKFARHAARRHKPRRLRRAAALLREARSLLEAREAK
jgi:aminoglycoside phosphotransferase (APT) family kinase protein